MGEAATDSKQPRERSNSFLTILNSYSINCISLYMKSRIKLEFLFPIITIPFWTILNLNVPLIFRLLAKREKKCTSIFNNFFSLSMFGTKQQEPKYTLCMAYMRNKKSGQQASFYFNRLFWKEYTVYLNWMDARGSSSIIRIF